MLAAEMKFSCHGLFWHIFGDEGFGEAGPAWEVSSFDDVDYCGRYWDK